MSQKYGLSAQNMLIKFKGFVFVVVVAVVVVFWVRGIPKSLCKNPYKVE